jgi:exopolysaccharide biosynthesis protein
MLDSSYHAPKKPAPAALVIISDIVLAGIALCVFALFHHVVPQDLTPEGGPKTAPVAIVEANGETDDFSAKFPDVFTDGEIISSDTTYKSKNVSVTIETVSEDGVTYYVADVYVRNPEYLKTALARDTFGKSITEPVLTMAKANGAVLAINGDYYGYHSERGVVIRNGLIYRINAYNDVLLMYSDGSMKAVDEETFKANTTGLIVNATQAWCFGPALIIDGVPVKEFDSDIYGNNPRTGIGYYEPGHYCFVVIDGRQEGYSKGMDLNEMTQVFVDLGCTIAYNLDGGKSSEMVFNYKTTNRPSDGGRDSSDIVMIVDE